MMTRSKLAELYKQACSELKVLRSDNVQLLQEHEDSELEIKTTFEKNTRLKCELADLELKYLDVVDRCTRLQDLVDSFSACNNTHELALHRINDLEMMACSYLSAGGAKPEARAACWTPSQVPQGLPLQGPSAMPQFMGAPATLGLPPNPALSHEPALDLTTTPSLQPRPSALPSDDDAE